MDDVRGGMAGAGLGERISRLRESGAGVELWFELARPSLLVRFSFPVSDCGSGSISLSHAPRPPSRLFSASAANMVVFSLFLFLAVSSSFFYHSFELLLAWLYSRARAGEYRASAIFLNISSKYAIFSLLLFFGYEE